MVNARRVFAQLVQNSPPPTISRSQIIANERAFCLLEAERRLNTPGRRLPLVGG
jgi:hypothetical protein